MAVVQFKSGEISLYRDHFKSYQVKSCDDLFAAIDVSIRRDALGRVGFWSGYNFTTLYYIHFKSSPPHCH